jgi:RimJ/RimL family protein N-acetyltransferase
LLEGKEVNLRAAEKDDVSLIAQWWGNAEYMGEHQDVMTISREELEKVMLERTAFFLIQKKDDTSVGHIGGWMQGPKMMQIGYAVKPAERRKGFGTEAIKLMVDYLFCTRDIARIQAPTDTKNTPSQRALEKAGFTRECTMRKSWYARGEHRDQYLYRILREEWREPKILTKTA